MVRNAKQKCNSVKIMMKKKNHAQGARNAMGYLICCLVCMSCKMRGSASVHGHRAESMLRRAVFEGLPNKKKNLKRNGWRSEWFNGERVLMKYQPQMGTFRYAGEL